MPPSSIRPHGQQQGLARASARHSYGTWTAYLPRIWLCPAPVVILPLSPTLPFAAQLRAEVLSQRSINDETANETTKILEELSAAQVGVRNLKSSARG